MKITRNIPAANMQTLYNAIEKVNRRARRAGMQETKIAIVASEVQDIPLMNSYVGATVRMEMHTVEIEIGFQSFEGWSLVAVLEPIADSSANVVKTVPGEELPAMYRTRYTCDHCNIDRNRNKTFVIRNESGEYMQVGSTCLQAFLPGSDLEGYADCLSDVLIAADAAEELDADDMNGDGARQTMIFNAAEFLAKVNVVIAKHGWVSRSAAEAQCKQATVSAVLFSIFSKCKEDKIEVTTEQVAEARAQIERAREILNAKRSLSDYEYNLLNSLGENVQYNQVGVFASVAAYVTREIVNAQTGGVHVGSVGSKVTVNVTVNRVTVRDSAYGLTYIVNMTDDSGNVLTWFASNDVLKEGDKVTLTGTVKAHETFNGKAQTIVTRCKVK